MIKSLTRLRLLRVQEFASRLQSGLVPNFARWADLAAEFWDTRRKSVTLSTMTWMKSPSMCLRCCKTNFGQEVHESFMDLAVGTGILYVEEGDAINPVVFSAIASTCGTRHWPR